MQELDKKTEKEILESMAETFNFEILDNKVRCRFCGKNLMRYAKGLINERMISHYSTFHKFPSQKTFHQWAHRHSK